MDEADPGPQPYHLAFREHNGPGASALSGSPRYGELGEPRVAVPRCCTNQSPARRHGLEGARLLEEVRRARDDLEPSLAGKLREGFAVQADHGEVVSADDQKGGRLDAWERVAGKIRPPSARDHGSDGSRTNGGGNERRGRGRRP